MAAERRVRARAFAKINLTLRVLGALPAGYHELRTMFQSVAWHDTLSARSVSGPFRLACTDAACPTDRTNLVWRAAEAVWTAAGRRGAPRDTEVRLVKRIPLAAGLGGGSSDAAAAIRSFAALWSVGLSPDEERAIAASLGADVPFFLEGGTALGVERGDVVFPMVDVPLTWVVLVIPVFRVSTKEAYGWWDQRHDDGEQQRLRPVRRARLRARSARERGWGPASIRNADLGAWITQMPERELINDLQRPVEGHHPEIRRLVDALRKHGAAYAAMSGSGSAVFGLFSRRSTAVRAARALGRPTRQVVLTRTLARARYRALACPCLLR